MLRIGFVIFVKWFEFFFSVLVRVIGVCFVLKVLFFGFMIINSSGIFIFIYVIFVFSFICVDSRF